MLSTLYFLPKKEIGFSVLILYEGGVFAESIPFVELGILVISTLFHGVPETFLFLEELIDILVDVILVLEVEIALVVCLLLPESGVLVASELVDKAGGVQRMSLLLVELHS